MGIQNGKVTLACRAAGCGLIMRDKTCFALCDPAFVWQAGECWAKTKEKNAIAKRKNAMRAYASIKAQTEDRFAG